MDILEVRATTDEILGSHMTTKKVTTIRLPLGLFDYAKAEAEALSVPVSEIIREGLSLRRLIQLGSKGDSQDG